MEEIINGLKQIKTRVDSGTITTVNGTETLLSKQLAKMIESAINYTRCCETLPIDKIQEYHIKRWNNALEANISMQEIREDMLICKKAINLSSSLKSNELK
jgi:uncharacterized protein (DUF2344 family)